MTSQIPLLVVGGIQRGGTTILKNLLMSHPHIRFYPFEARILRKYEQTVKSHIWDVFRSNFKSVVRNRKRRRSPLYTQYIPAILKENKLNGSITYDEIHRAMIASLSQDYDIYVGDKYPDYLVRYPTFIHRPNTKCVFIYRHPYDVVASTLIRVQGDWQGRAWTVKYDSVEKISHYWLDRMQMIYDIQQLDSNALILCYENFVTQTSNTAKQVAEHLNTDSDLFDVMILHKMSIGKYKTFLSDSDVATINRIAGDMMRQFDYL